MTNRCQVHKYRKFRGKKPVYHCVSCPSFVTEEYIIGHKTRCWKCDKGFTMSQNSLRLKPICDECKGKGIVKNKELSDLVNELLSGIPR